MYNTSSFCVRELTHQGKNNILVDRVGLRNIGNRTWINVQITYWTYDCTCLDYTAYMINYLATSIYKCKLSYSHFVIYIETAKMRHGTLFPIRYALLRVTLLKKAFLRTLSSPQPNNNTLI